VSDVKLSIEHFSAGNALLSIQVGDATYAIYASYLSPGGHTRDSLEDMAYLGASAKRGVPMEVWFEGEPQQWRLSVSPDPAPPGAVDVTVHSFQDRVKRMPRELGEPVFKASCSGAEFARAVRHAFSVWKHSAEDYEVRWYHPFPARAFSLLEEALSS